MFGSNHAYGANAYANVGVETGISGASPHQLIVMLFDGAIFAITDALRFLDEGNIAEKGRSISKAISIVESGLRASLDKTTGGDIAENLDSLYEYMSRQLLLGNMNNEAAKFQEVQQLLKDLKGAWEAIAPTVRAETAPPTQSAYDPLAPRPNKYVEA